jgi:hypothetical protein
MAFNYQLALENATQPLRTAGGLALARAMADRERAERRKDQIDKEARLSKREIDRETRRIEEQKDQERRQYYQSLLARKVEGITKDMTYDELLKADTDDARKTAKTALGFALKSQNRIEQQIKDNEEKMFGAINEQATGQQKMNFLRTALSDPTVRASIDDKSFEQISKLMSATRTPEEADANADKVFNAIKKNTTLLFWGKGGTKAAENFRSIYNQVSQTGLGAEQQAKLQIYYQKSKDLGDSLEKAQQYSDRVFSEHGRFAPPEMASLFTGSSLSPATASPSVNPDLLGKAANILSTPSSATPPPQPSAPMTGIIPTAARAAVNALPPDVIAAPGELANIAGSALADIPTVLGNVGRRLITGAPDKPYITPDAWMGRTGDTPPIPPPSNVEIAAGNPARAMKLANRSTFMPPDPHDTLKQAAAQFLQQNPNPVMPPYAPGIDQKIKQIGIELGGKESDWPVFTTKLQAGDRAAIATYNVLYQEVLSREGHGTTLGLPPISNN